MVPFEKIEIDILDLLSKSDSGNKVVASVTCYATRYVECKIFSDSRSGTVAKF